MFAKYNKIGAITYEEFLEAAQRYIIAQVFDLGKLDALIDYRETFAPETLLVQERRSVLLKHIVDDAEIRAKDIEKVFSRNKGRAQRLANIQRVDSIISVSRRHEGQIEKSQQVISKVIMSESRPNSKPSSPTPQNRENSHSRPTTGSFGISNAYSLPKVKGEQSTEWLKKNLRKSEQNCGEVFEQLSDIQKHYYTQLYPPPITSPGKMHQSEKGTDFYLAMQKEGTVPQSRSTSIRGF